MLSVFDDRKMVVRKDGHWSYPWTVMCPCCGYGSAFHEWRIAFSWAIYHILGAHK